MTKALAIRNVLTLDPMSDVPQQKTFVVRDGRIVQVTDGDVVVPEGARVIEGRDRLLTPGLVNAHMHSPLNILKGTGDVLNHPAFMWRNQADTAKRMPDEIRLSALMGCIEHLRAGTTAVIDHFPEQGFGEDDIAAVADAYDSAGMRALIALRIFDEPYTDIEPPGGVPSDAFENPLTPPPLDESLALVRAGYRTS